MHHEIKQGTIFDKLIEAFNQYDESSNEGIEEILDYLVSYKWTKEEFQSMHITRQNKTKVNLPKNLIETLNNAFKYERYKHKGNNSDDDEVDDDDEDMNEEQE